jgi:hypothetical protein
MSSDNKTALYTGAFWAVLAFMYGWQDARPGSSKLLAAMKAALWTFVVIALFLRGNSAILPGPGEGPADCERYPGIFGC